MISFLISLFLFLGTTEFFPHWIIIGIIPLTYFVQKDRKIVFDNNHKILLIIVVLCLVNETIGLSFGVISNPNYLELLPYLSLVFATLYISKSISNNVIKWTLLFILFEIFLGVLQYLLGVKTFTHPTIAGNIDDNILYNKHVFGISGNSSGFAFKVFFLLLLYHRNHQTIRINKYLILISILTGLLITFNRTIIVATILFGVLIIIYNLRNKIWSYKKSLVLIAIALALIFILIILYKEFIILQFLRGNDTISTSGNALSERDVVYKFFWDFIVENPIFGNHSFKYLYYSMGKEYHAHNSYLQLFANNGIIIGTLFMLFITKNITSNNYIYIFPILFTGLLQTSIFWGISFTDVWFYFLLFTPQIKNATITYLSKDN